MSGHPWPYLKHEMTCLKDTPVGDGKQTRNGTYVNGTCVKGTAQGNALTNSFEAQVQRHMQDVRVRGAFVGYCRMFKS